MIICENFVSLEFTSGSDIFQKKEKEQRFIIGLTFIECLFALPPNPIFVGHRIGK